MINNPLRLSACLLLAFLYWAPAALSQDSETQSSGSALSVSEAAIATGMENLTPQDSSDSFSPEVGRLFAFTKITGAEGDTLIKHLWFHGDELVAEVELPVRSSSWRTYSSKNILPGMTGEWKVDITTEDGTLLKSIPFMIQ